MSVATYSHAFPVDGQCLSSWKTGWQYYISQGAGQSSRVARELQCYSVRSHRCQNHCLFTLAETQRAPEFDDLLHMRTDIKFC